MQNPWSHLPSDPPFVLESDTDRIDAFNARAGEATRVRLEILPELFLGRPEAPVVLLNLNPGFTDDDLEWHERPRFREQSRASLAHAASPYPFYLLNPELDAPGVRWWRRRLGALIKATDDIAVARSVLCVELFPYHSRKFGHSRMRFPSQEYGFDLVRTSLGRGAVIVVMRGWRFWREAVPELENYRQLYSLRSVQNVAITARNCPGGFDEIVRAIRGSA